MHVSEVEHSCCSCGCTFWITAEHNKILSRSKKDFHCPNGHIMNFCGKSPEQKLKESEEKANRYEKYYADELDSSEKLRNQIKGFKGNIAKLK